MNSARVKKFEQIIRDELIDIRKDGSFLLNMEHFNFATGLTMCIDEKWEALFGIAKREPESKLTQAYTDLAFAIQKVTEDIMLRMAYTARKLTSSKNLVMAGGVALNCVANGKILKEGLFRDIWIQPAAGDAGGALGAAFAAHHIWKGEERKVVKGKDAMKGAFLGPKFNADDVERLRRKYNAVYKEFSNVDTLCKQVAKLLDNGQVVGWFQGRMEYGPRALGNRSILGDPRAPDMQKKLNLKIKFREGFRPFAPSVLEEDMLEYFELGNPSPYMLLVAPVLQKRRKPLPKNYKKLGVYEQLYHLRSDIPAVTHVDYSARIQSVSRETNERYWKLINAFKEKTGYGLLVNTSFNVRGEPLVCSLEDAYQCFMRTEMDWLVIDDFVFDKKEQPKWDEGDDWKDKYMLD
jgi:carbamoyltransferase